MTTPSLGRILIVDDEPELAEALRDSLTRHHYLVSATTSPEEAKSAWGFAEYITG